MKVFTDENGRVQVIVEDVAEEQVIRQALYEYRFKNHENKSHMNLAFDMYDQVVEEFVKDVELETVES